MGPSIYTNRGSGKRKKMSEQQQKSSKARLRPSSELQNEHKSSWESIRFRLDGMASIVVNRENADIVKPVSCDHLHEVQPGDKLLYLGIELTVREVEFIKLLNARMQENVNTIPELPASREVKK